MKTTKVKATISEGADNKLTLRVYVPAKFRDEHTLEKGKQPSGMINVVII